MAFKAQRTKVPFVDKSLTTTGDFGSFPSHLMVQCLLPKYGTRPRRQNTRQWRRTEKCERTDSHSGQTDRVIMTTANGVGRLYPPEVELLEPRAAWKQKPPQVGLGIKLVCLRLRVLLSGQLGLLSLLELFLMGILLVIRAGHRSQGNGEEITEMWRLKVGTAGAAMSVWQRGWALAV